MWERVKCGKRGNGREGNSGKKKKKEGMTGE